MIRLDLIYEIPMWIALVGLLLWIRSVLNG